MLDMHQATVSPSDAVIASSVPSTARPTKAVLAGALDALDKDKPQAVEAVREYLLTLAGCFGEFALEEPANGLLDTKVLAAIDKSRPYLDEFRRLVTLLARHPDDAAATAPLCEFFAVILRHKKPVGEAADQCFLWADAYRFILRELFLSCATILIRHDQFGKAGLILDQRYRATIDASGADVSFVAFDGYVKTLDEFRNRRLRLGRMSVCSDLIRERADEALCPFALVMQVDFVLCLRSLLHEQTFFERWYPRTLVFAEQFAQSGLDMFVMASDQTRFAGLARLLHVADRTQLIDKFEDVYDAWNLAHWELARVPLDFRGYLALNNPALSN